MSTMNDTDKDFLSCLGMLLFVLLVIPLSSIFNGWILSVMWGWFIVPFGVTSIGVAWAIGLSFIFSLLRGGYSSYQNETKKDNVTLLILRSFYFAFVPGLIILAFGYVVHLFM